ncbi:MAG: UvrD-helicase domain-containing protein [Oscillospiraceae bacterium]
MVSAAAGSGKTRVLTERLMRWITEGDAPRSIDNFLIITFSTAAAAELRSRISEELSARAAADPGSKRLRRESALVRRAQIGTIHSFCSALLREYAGRAGIARTSHSGRGRARELRAIAGDGAGGGLRRGGAGLHPARGHRGRGTDDRRLESLVLELHGKLQSTPPGLGRGSRSSSVGAEDAADTLGPRAARARRTSCSGGPGVRRARSLSRALKDGQGLCPGLSETASSPAARQRAAEGWDALREALPIEFRASAHTARRGEDPEPAGG